jgi:hypothetical protein
MDVCILNQDGAIFLHRTMHTSPEMFLKAMVPYREELVVAVACLFPWYWLADLCAQEQLAFVLGHALSMHAIHGGQAQHEKIDAQQIALRLRGGMLPHAYGSPAEMRATRDLRRRVPLMRQRAALLPPMQHTPSQYTLPESGQKLASTAHRDGVAERCPAPAGPKSIAGDLALLGPDDHLRRAMALSVLKTAQPHDATLLSLLRTVPGIGAMLRVGRLEDLHALARFPRVHDGVSSCRLGTCAKEAAGKQYGPAGTTSGQASLTWAVAAAAVRGLRRETDDS